jgi:hypothetical protein
MAKSLTFHPWNLNEVRAQHPDWCLQPSASVGPESILSAVDGRFGDCPSDYKPATDSDIRRILGLIA